MSDADGRPTRVPFARAAARIRERWVGRVAIVRTYANPVDGDPS